MKYSWNAWVIRQLISKPNPSGPSIHTETKHYIDQIIQELVDLIVNLFMKMRNHGFQTNLPKDSNIAANDSS